MYKLVLTLGESMGFYLFITEADAIDFFRWNQFHEILKKNSWNLVFCCLLLNHCGSFVTIFASGLCSPFECLLIGILLEKINKKYIFFLVKISTHALCCKMNRQIAVCFYVVTCKADQKISKISVNQINFYIVLIFFLISI